MKASALGLALMIGLGAATAWGEGAHVFVVGEGERLRRDDTAAPAVRGEDNEVWRPGEAAHLSALRGEVAAIQVGAVSGEELIDGVRVEVEGLSDIQVERFVEHYVHVQERSNHSGRPLESLGWSERARPSDAISLGWVPDALLPVDAMERAPGRWRPYPLALEPRTLATIWVDLSVPVDAPPGLRRGQIVVRAGDRVIAAIPLTLDVVDAELPYRPVSFLVYYDRTELRARPGEVDAVERQLWQLLHAHGVDALADLGDPSDVARLATALDGSLFTPAHGYRGPGEGIAPAAAALGAYGGFGAPDPVSTDRAQATLAQVPSAVEDVFLYAVDEDCDSPLGPAWRAAIASRPAMSRLRAAHSCSRDPRSQGVDLVLMAAQSFDTELARRARSMGTAVWVYNGALPQSGSMLLDAPPASLTVDGWIAASHAVGRWFLWESTFYNDDNRGGHGPIDPFSTATSFHNNQGDSANGDGLLVYPGSQEQAYPERSLGLPQMLPSMRLKALRRGIEDAGYFALARARAPRQADAILDATLGASLDEAPSRSRRPRLSLAEGRRQLLALIAPGQSIAPAAVERQLTEAASARARRFERVAPTWSVYRWFIAALLLAVVVTLAARVELGWPSLAAIFLRRGTTAARAVSRRRLARRSLQTSPARARHPPR